MTRQEITQLVAFNQWADEQFFEVLSQLPAEQYARDLGSSHGGLHGTLAHIVAVQRGWLSRWQQQPGTGAEAVRRLHSLAELRTYWQDVCREMNQFLTTLDERMLQDVLSTITPAGTFAAPYWQMIQHVVDHSSYHRGQLVTMLRQLGATPPSTGLMRFYRDAAR